MIFIYCPCCENVLPEPDFAGMSNCNNKNCKFEFYQITSLNDPKFGLFGFSTELYHIIYDDRLYIIPNQLQQDLLSEKDIIILDNFVINFKELDLLENKIKNLLVFI